MKTLLLLRHAKSSWENPDLADIDRPLNKRGKRDAPRVGRLLREQDIAPDLILTSPARRTQKTVELAIEASGYNVEIEVREEFYPGSPDDYIEALNSLPDRIGSVMVVGHNPGLEELLTELTGEADPLPTAALAQIELSIQKWTDLSAEAQGRLINLWRVRELE